MSETQTPRPLAHVLGRGSSAGTWSSRTVWCCLPSGCPARSAGPASSAAWSDSPAGGDGANKQPRIHITRKNTHGCRIWERGGDSPLPAPGCESGTSPAGWRWWRAESPSDPAEAQREHWGQNLRKTQCCCHLPPLTSCNRPDFSCVGKICTSLMDPWWWPLHLRSD